MPSLKDLACSIELSHSQETLQEFGTSYGDGLVETFVAVPSKPQPFSVHLTSEKFIAPGIAIYVFIDGVYQCNRNRQDLKLGKGSDSRSLVDFRVRQKEEKQKDGSMIAREWTFEKLNIASADDSLHRCSEEVLANIGCIEVVVLRCAGSRKAPASQMNTDGANDIPDREFGLDGHVPERLSGSVYDDRLPYSHSRGNSLGPPPPLGNYQPPYAETVRSHGRLPARSKLNPYSPGSPESLLPRNSHIYSRYAGPINPDTHRSNGVPTLGVQYGSGPLPPVGEPFYYPSIGAALSNDPTVNPEWLGDLLTKAVKQGVEESHRKLVPQGTSIEKKLQNYKTEAGSQLPGAWPASPFDAPAQLHTAAAPTWSARDREDESVWSQPQDQWTARPARSREEARVKWNDAETIWESSSDANEWNTQKKTPITSWDTAESWRTNDPNRWGRGSRRGRSQISNTSVHARSRSISPVTIRNRDRLRSKDRVTAVPRSKSHSRRFRTDEDIPTSSEGQNCWAHNDITSPSVAEESSADTLQPPYSRSKATTSRRRPEKISSQYKTAHSHRKGSIEHADPTLEWQRMPNTHRNPSRPITVAPSMVDIPASVPTIRSHRIPSSSEFAHSRPHPLPYAPTLPDFASHKVGPNPIDIKSDTSSSWYNNKKSWETAETRVGRWGTGHSPWNSAIINGKATDDWKTVDEAPWGKTDAPKQYRTVDRNEDIDGWATRPLLVSKSHQNDKRTGWDAELPGWDTIDNTTAPWTDEKGVCHTNNKDKATDWETKQSWTNTPIGDKPTQDIWTSKRHSKKTLSRYRQPRSASEVGPKPHWQFPPPLSEKTPLPVSKHSGSFIAPKEPLLKVSKQAASEKGIEHQVRAGKGIQYDHVVSHPEYLDRLDKPYAVFRFKYRSKSILQSILDHALIPNNADLTHPTPASALALAKQKLLNLPQTELVDKMLRLQTRLGEKPLDAAYGEEKETAPGQGGKKERQKGERRASGSGKTNIVAMNMTEKWVRQHSRPTSKQAGSGSGHRSGRSSKSKKASTKNKPQEATWTKDEDEPDQVAKDWQAV